MKYFKLPDLGEGLPEAEILEWHVKEGEEVSTDQLMVSVETAKAIVDVPSPQDGVIATLFGEPGDTIHTGEPLVEFVGDMDEDSGTVVGEIQSAEQSIDEDDFYVGASPSTRQHRRGQATPSVRAMAKRLNVELDQLQGTGRDGVITAEDLEHAASVDRRLGKAEPLRGVRKHMAKTMAMAHAEVVPVSICEDVDIHSWGKGEDTTIRLIHAIAVASATEPALNAWFDGASLSRRLHKKVHLGVAVDTEKGLFVPVVKNIGNRSLEDIREGLDRLRHDVANRTIPPSELQGATITLTNFGTIAGRYASPIVVPPTVAILGAGSIRMEPVVIDGEIAIRRIMPLSFTFDHRAATGGEAARFIRAVIDDLEKSSVA